MYCTVLYKVPFLLNFTCCRQLETTQMFIFWTKSMHFWVSNCKMIVQYSTVQWYNVLYCNVKYCIELYYTTFHCTLTFCASLNCSLYTIPLGCHIVFNGLLVATQTKSNPSGNEVLLQNLWRLIFAFLVRNYWQMLFCSLSRLSRERKLARRRKTNQLLVRNKIFF